MPLRLIQKTCSFIFIFTLLSLALPPASISAELLQDPLKTKNATQAKFVQPASCNIPDPKRLVSLPELISIALCNANSTKANWHSFLAQQARLGSSRSAYLPRVDADVGYDYSDSSTSRSGTTNSSNGSSYGPGISLSYLLYDFGGREALVESSRYNLVSAEEQFNAARQDVIFNTIKSYYDYLSGIAIADAQRDNEASAKASFEAASLRYQVGKAPLVEKLQAQTVYTQANLERTKAEYQVKINFGILMDSLGLNANQKLNVEATPIQPPADKNIFAGEIDAMIEQAKKDRPDLASLIAGVESSKANLKLEEAQHLPSISLSSRASTNFDEDSDRRNDSGIGVNLSVPLFTGFDTSYRIKAAKEQAKADQQQMLDFQNQVALDVWQDYQLFNTATNTLNMSEDVLSSARETERVALGRYKSGAGSLIDLLDAQAQLASARTQRAQAVYGWFTARASLLRSLGSINREFS